MKTEVITENVQKWKYETDEFDGICVIAKDKMRIKFIFESCGKEFFDVLKINQVIETGLRNPVSVEFMADFLATQFRGLSVTVSGRAESHGWITSSVVKKA
jgi:hypothetical protein